MIESALKRSGRLYSSWTRKAAVEEFGARRRHGSTDAHDPYVDGSEETREEFTANDFRITRALDSLLTSARAIKHDESRLRTLSPGVNTFATY